MGENIDWLHHLHNFQSVIHKIKFVGDVCVCVLNICCEMNSKQLHLKLEEINVSVTQERSVSGKTLLLCALCS